MRTRNRLIDVDGVVNFRDLGGLRFAGGSTTAFGKIFRSGSLDRATDLGIATLVDELRVKTVVDLRTPTEIAWNSDSYRLMHDPRVRYAQVSILPDHVLNSEIFPVGQPIAIGEVYFRHVVNAPKEIAQAVALVVAPQNAPIVLHCAAGRDRTGMVVALLLDAIGVLREDVIADYAATNASADKITESLRLNPIYAADRPVSEHEPLGADPRSVIAFLDQVEARFGDSRQCLQWCGVPVQDIDRLNTLLSGGTISE